MSFILLSVVLCFTTSIVYSQNFVPVDTLLLGFMADLRHNLTASLQEPMKEVREFIEEQKYTMKEILEKLSDLEAEVSNLQECCRSGQEDFAWSQRLCSRVARTCPGGWTAFNDSCYFISNTPGTWNEGLEYCRSMGADFVQISGFAEWDFVSSLIKEKTWLGLNDIDEEGTFRWTYGNSLPEYNKWISGEPNNYYGDEDCVVSNPSYDNYWNDLNCERNYKFMCETSLEEMYV